MGLCALLGSHSCAEITVETDGEGWHGSWCNLFDVCQLEKMKKSTPVTDNAECTRNVGNIDPPGSIAT